METTAQLKLAATQEERGGILGIYFSGVKMTLKVRIAPMETTVILNFPKIGIL